MKHFSAFGRRCWPAVLALALLTGCTSADLQPASSTIGLTGARARFITAGNVMYVVNGEELRVLDLGPNGTGQPVPAPSVPLGVTIETIYLSGSYLFVGTSAGMNLFDVSQPLQPLHLGYYSQAASCDPLVVRGRWAYLTMRQDRSCGAGPNQLQVVDLRDPARPTLTRTYPLSHPYGLALDSTRLAVCDEGVKLFDLSAAPTLTQLDAFPMDAYEATTAPTGLLLLTGKEGLYQCQYDARNHSLRVVSVIPVVFRP